MTMAWGGARRHDASMRGRVVVLVGAVIAADCTANTLPVTSGVPMPPDAGITTSTSVSTFAVTQLLLGETDRDGGASTNAWKELGYDLDGRVTTMDSSGVCTLQLGANRSTQVDGVGGIDNAWGSQLVAPFQTFLVEPSPSIDATQIIDSGEWTLLLQVTGLSDDSNQTARGLSAQVFVGARTAGPPAFDSTTDWPLRPSSVADASRVPFGAVVQFSDVYVMDGTFVARTSAAPLSIPLVLQSHNTNHPGETTLPLEIHDAVITFDHVAPATAAHGTIAGVLDPASFVSAVRALVGRVSPSLCGDVFAGIAAEMLDAEDILEDGTNAPDVPCDGISIGLGFTAQLVANPTTIGADPPPAIDPCAVWDAGAD
jgi:hypothetical protein